MSRKFGFIVAFALVLGSLLVFGQAIAQSDSNNLTSSISSSLAGGADRSMMDDSGEDPGGNHPPNRFYRVVPLDGAVVPRNHVVFQWRASADPDGDPVHYYLQWTIDNVPYQQILVHDTTDIEDFSSLSLPAGQVSIVWHVYACDAFHHSVEAYNGSGSFVLDAAAPTRDPRVLLPGRYFVNYPNPFNPVTSLAFSLPHAGDVSLIIFDMTGRKVWEYQPGKLSAGEHRIQFNAENLPSGIYFARLNMDNVQLNRKLLLVK